MTTNHLAVNACVARLTDTDVGIVEVFADASITTREADALISFHFTQVAIETSAARTIEPTNHIL